MLINSKVIIILMQNFMRVEVTLTTVLTFGRLREIEGKRTVFNCKPLDLLHRNTQVGHIYNKQCYK